MKKKMPQVHLTPQALLAYQAAEALFVTQTPQALLIPQAHVASQASQALLPRIPSLPISIGSPCFSRFTRSPRTPAFPL